MAVVATSGLTIWLPDNYDFIHFSFAEMGDTP